MSDNYNVGDVTVSPAGGGYYDLSHPKLSEPERVRGKENADARARQLHDENQPAEGHMEPQGGLPPAPPAPAVAETPNAPTPDKGTAQDDDTIQVSRSEFQALMDRVNELQAAGISTVVAEPQPDSFATAQAQVPTSFEGEMANAQRKALNKLGIETTKIILEESTDIPPTGLFISHNGRSYMIKPGEPVDVPDFLIGVLDDAVTSSPIIDQTTRKVLGYRDRMKYPYRRV